MPWLPSTRLIFSRRQPYQPRVILRLFRRQISVGPVRRRVEHDLPADQLLENPSRLVDLVLGLTDELLHQGFELPDHVRQKARQLVQILVRSLHGVEQPSDDALVPCMVLFFVVCALLHAPFQHSTYDYGELRDFSTPDDLRLLGMRGAYVLIRRQATVKEIPLGELPTGKPSLPAT